MSVQSFLSIQEVGGGWRRRLGEGEEKEREEGGAGPHHLL